MKKLILIFVIVLLIVGGGAFYGGIKYQQSHLPAGRNFSGQFGTRNANNANTNNMNNSVANGQIISQDNQSITVQLQNGSSKIVFFSEATQIMKADKGSAADLTNGENVMVNGKTNSDGSLTAQMIQIRPTLTNPGK